MDYGDVAGGDGVNAVDLLSELPVNWQKVPLKSVCDFAASNVDKHSFENEYPVQALQLH